jgi:hypothetical protein
VTNLPGAGPHPVFRNDADERDGWIFGRLKFSKEPSVQRRRGRVPSTDRAPAADTHSFDGTCVCSTTSAPMKRHSPVTVGIAPTDRSPPAVGLDLGIETRLPVSTGRAFEGTLSTRRTERAPRRHSQAAPSHEASLLATSRSPPLPPSSSWRARELTHRFVPFASTRDGLLRLPYRAREEPRRRSGHACRLHLRYRQERGPRCRNSTRKFVKSIYVSVLRAEKRFCGARGARTLRQSHGAVGVARMDDQARPREKRTQPAFDKAAPASGWYGDCDVLVLFIQTVRIPAPPIKFLRNPQCSHQFFADSWRSSAWW